jgi:hypothetical protein
MGADLPGDGVTTFADLENNGGQENFCFARMTVNQTGRFTGDIAVLGYDGAVHTLPFNFLLPGTEADFAMLEHELPMTLEYSLDPPPPLPDPPPSPTFYPWQRYGPVPPPDFEFPPGDPRAPVDPPAPIPEPSDPAAPERGPIVITNPESPGDINSGDPIFTFPVQSNPS